MPGLRDLLVADNVRAKAVKACAKLVQDEVGAKRGLTGAAIRTAYGVIGRIRPTVFEDAVDALLPDFCDALDPYYADAREQAERDGKPVSAVFKEAVPARSNEVAEALLGVTDRRIAEARPTIRKSYERLRGTALGHVEQAVPGLAQVVSGFLDPS